MNTKTKAVIAYIIIFLAGLSAGFVLHELISPNGRGYPGGMYDDGDRVENQGRGYDEPRWNDTMRDRAAAGLIRHLNLSEEQKGDFFDRMNSYKARIRDDIQDFRHEEKEYIRRQYSDFRAEVSSILSEEQLTKLDSVAHPDSVGQHRMRRQRGSGPGNR